MSAFKKVIMVPGQPEIAKVNRSTGFLYLSDSIWKGLPESEKAFVLFHENGHLKLQTADEFAANSYAVDHFLGVRTFTNKELAQKIMVMRSIFDKADGQTSNFTGPVTEAVSSAVGSIFQNLSVLGIGSKARQNEAAANAAAQSQVYSAQAAAAVEKSKSTMTIIVVAGVLLIVGLAIYFTLKK
jgi:hypothetical protein